MQQWPASLVKVGARLVKVGARLVKVAARLVKMGALHQVVRQPWVQQLLEVPTQIQGALQTL